MADIEADVIIVGSGIAGALLAAKLASAGVKVAILEAGARVDRAAATQRFWDAPIRVPECPYPPSLEANHPISNDPDYWYRQSGPDKFKSTYLKVVGGTTWHWLGTCLRFVPNDFRLSSAYGCGADWPVTYQDLEPFYAQAEAEIGVSGDADEALGSPRSTPYPMPAIPTMVEVGGQGRVAAIRFKRWDGSDGVASGKVFVLAAHAIEIPRLLLNSRNEARSRGVANGSDQLGRNLMDHPAQLSWALAAAPVWPYRGPLSTSGIEIFRDGAFRKERPAFRIEIGNDGWSWPTGAPTTTAADLARLGLRGPALA